MRAFFLSAVLLCAVQAEKAGIDLEKDGVVDLLWAFVDKDENNTVGADELEVFYSRYDNKDSSPSKLNLFEDDYNSGLTSAVSDFGISATSASVYFKLQDIVDWHEDTQDFYERLTYEDMNAVSLIGDADLNGRLNETEFEEIFLRIFRGANFGKIYVDFRPNVGNGLYDDYLRLADWMRAFDTFDIAGAGSMTADQFSTAWVLGGYGGESQGRALHAVLDVEGSAYLFREEWQLYFFAIDYDGDSLLSIEEVLALDYLLNEGFLPRFSGSAKQFRREYLKL